MNFMKFKVMEFDKINKNNIIYSQDTYNKSILEAIKSGYDIRYTVPIIYPIMYNDCSNKYIRGSYNPIIEKSSFERMIIKWRINELLKDGKRKEAVELLLEGRKVKYPSIKINT